MFLHDPYLTEHWMEKPDRFSKQGVLGVVTDLILLKESDFFVGTFSSNVSEINCRKPLLAAPYGILLSTTSTPYLLPLLAAPYGILLGASALSPRQACSCSHVNPQSYLVASHVLALLLVRINNYATSKISLF